MDGAFFPQPDLQMPEEEVGEHTCDHVVMPAHELSDLVMVHAELAFGFLKALLNGPTQPTEPHERFQPRAYRSIADEVGVFGVVLNGSADEQP